MNPELVKILEYLIKVNPYNRSTAFEILKSPLFDKMKNEITKSKVFKKLQINIDSDDAYDYESDRSTKYNIEDLTN